MTEEQIEKLLETINDFEKADLFSGIVITIFLVSLIGWTIFEIYRLKKIKQMHNEYKQTLTEEDLEKIKRYNRYK